MSNEITNYRAIIAKAIQAQEQGDIVKALEYLQNALQLNPDNPELHNNLAVLFYQNQDLECALKHYAKAVNLKPDYVEAHFNLGILFIKQGKIKEAIKQFNNVITLIPAHYPSHKFLADLYLQSNDFQQAKKHYEMVVENQPKNVQAINNLGVVYLRLDDPETAIHFFTKVLAVDENHQDARNNLAATYLQEDRYDNARRHYQELLKRDPENCEAHYNLAVALMAIGQLEEAQVHFQKVFTFDYQHIDARINLAAIYMKLNEFNKAIQLYQQVLAMEENHPVATYMLDALSNKQAAQTAPAEYVKNLFDNYAGYYDKHITEVLHYQVPALLHEAINQIDDAPEKPWRILDLGCGTGLSGTLFRNDAKELIGVDISPKMLGIAKHKNIYDQLVRADINNYLQDMVDKVDCVLAADVFVYMGDVTAIFKEVSRLLTTKGLFAFSVEALDKQEKKDFTLQKTARFKHHENYITKLAKINQLEIKQKKEIIPRYQENQPIPGLLFVLQKNL